MNRVYTVYRVGLRVLGFRDSMGLIRFVGGFVDLSGFSGYRVGL